jgi:uncharacterized membrane protein
MTLSVTSMGHSEISFFETPTDTPTDKFVSAAFCISAPFESVFSEESIGALMPLFNIATLFVIFTLVGAEFSVSAFVNPAAWRLEPESQLKMLSRFALVLGKVMPVWYLLSTLVLGIQTWLHWHTPERAILLTADAIWVLTSVASIFVLVPLNSRVAEGAADWQQIHRIWDRRHRVRIVALATAAVLLTYVVVR